MRPIPLRLLSAFLLPALLLACSEEHSSKPVPEKTTGSPAAESVPVESAETQPAAAAEPSAAPSPSVSPAPSKLWGEAGELWTPQSRLPDFSHAGYKGGEPVPDVPVAANVKEFGAVGDGVADDTGAIRKAIAAVPSGAVLLPAGRYKITDRLVINKPGVVLRGEGPDATTLYMPKSLLEIERGAAFEGLAPFKNPFSFGGAFVEIEATSPAPPLTKVTADALRGDRTLTVENAATIKPGMPVHLWMAANPELGRHLHADMMDISRNVFGRGKKYYTDWVANITAVEGNTVTLDRPLRTDVRVRWSPELRAFSPKITGSGVEGMTFEFAGREKREHLMEEGFNAVELQTVADCWVRNLRIIDADIGVLVSDSRFCTIENIELTADKRPGIVEEDVTGITGHHGLWATGFAQDNLFQNFVFKTKFHHDLSVENFANGNVFRRGRGPMINLDHHCLAPYENLFTDIQTDDISRIWRASGAAPRLPHTAARTTVWNLRYETGVLRYRGKTEKPFPPEWPQLNVIGFRRLPEKAGGEGTWIEPLPGGVLPPDLYEAQRAARMKAQPNDTP